MEPLVVSAGDLPQDLQGYSAVTLSKHLGVISTYMTVMGVFPPPGVLSGVQDDLLKSSFVGWSCKDVLSLPLSLEELLERRQDADLLTAPLEHFRFS